MNTKKLRQKILDLAIRGKLVPQSTGDVNIVKLGDVCKLSNGISKRKGENGASTVVLRLADLDDYAISFANVRAINLSEQEREQYRLNENDLLFVRVNGSKANVGKTYVYDNLIIEVAYCDHLIRGQLHSDVDAHYLLYIMRSSSCRADIDRLIVTTAGQNTISQGSLNSIEFPLPPLAEQRRIVAAIDSAFAIIDEIECNKADLQAAVTTAKQKILSLAIQGKLVPQNPDDESAKVLFDEIRHKRKHLMEQGAIKKEKPFNSINKDEIPYSLPQNWVWCRLGELAHYKKGPFGSSITKAMFVPDSDDAVKVYEQKNAIYKDASLGNYFVSREKFNELKGFEVFSNEIIVSCAGTIGEAYIMPDNMRQGIINQALMKISLYENRISDFYLMYFDFVLKESAKDEAKGTAMKNIPPFDVLKQFPVPLPPLTEQHRIIAAIDEAFSQLDEIMKNLNRVEVIAK